MKRKVAPKKYPQKAVLNACLRLATLGNSQAIEALQQTGLKVYNKEEKEKFAKENKSLEISLALLEDMQDMFPNNLQVKNMLQTGNIDVGDKVYEIACKLRTERKQIEAQEKHAFALYNKWLACLAKNNVLSVYKKLI